MKRETQIYGVLVLVLALVTGYLLWPRPKPPRIPSSSLSDQPPASLTKAPVSRQTPSQPASYQNFVGDTAVGHWKSK